MSKNMEFRNWRGSGALVMLWTKLGIGLKSITGTGNIHPSKLSFVRALTRRILTNSYYGGRWQVCGFQRMNESGVASSKSWYHTDPMTTKEAIYS